MKTFFFGVLYTFIFAVFYFLYRFYKHLGRRCENPECGSIVDVERWSRMILPAGETIQFYQYKKGWKRFVPPRWWIPRVMKIQFKRCSHPDCKLKNITQVSGVVHGPISIWHGLWVWWTDRSQYYFQNDEEFLVREYGRMISHDSSLDGCADKVLPSLVPKPIRKWKKWALTLIKF